MGPRQMAVEEAVLLLRAPGWSLGTGWMQLAWTTAVCDLGEGSRQDQRALSHGSSSLTSSLPLSSLPSPPSFSFCSSLTPSLLSTS